MTPQNANGQLSLFGEPVASPTPKKGTSQGNLFAEFTDEGTSDAEFSTLASLDSIEYDYQLLDTEEK